MARITSGDVASGDSVDCATDLGAVDDERGISSLSLRARVRRILVHGVCVMGGLPGASGRVCVQESSFR